MDGEIVVLDYDWLRFNAISGNAGTVNNTITALEANYGRATRSKTVVATTTGGVSKQCVVTQSACDEFITMRENTRKIGDGESSIVLTGESNASLLNVTLGSNASGVTLSSIEISLDGGTTWSAVTNDTSIVGDPGLTDKYKFRLTLAVSSFSLNSGSHLSVVVRGSSNGIDETQMQPTSTSMTKSTDTYDLGSSTPLTITGTSDSSSLTLGGTLANLPCSMYISFDNGLTWSSYTPGDTITNSAIDDCEPYLFKVEVDTSSLTAETADMTLSVYDNGGTLKGSTTVGFTETV